jgi:hypothetical protein
MDATELSDGCDSAVVWVRQGSPSASLYLCLVSSGLHLLIDLGDLQLQDLSRHQGRLRRARHAGEPPPRRVGPTKWQHTYRRRQKQGATLTEVPRRHVELLIVARRAASGLGTTA